MKLPPWRPGNQRAGEGEAASGLAVNAMERRAASRAWLWPSASAASPCLEEVVV